jgi:hypothetical protein
MEILNTIISGLTTCAIVFAVIQININKKQLFFSTIAKCVSDYRSLGEINKLTNDPNTISKYVDLTNEELFYFQNKYIPKIIMMEWIDGMIDFMPITNSYGVIINNDACIAYLAEKRAILFKNYPRIRYAFEVKNHYDFSLIYSEVEDQGSKSAKERLKLIKEILKNVSAFKWA